MSDHNQPSSSSSSNSQSVVDQLCDITNCSNAVAVKLLNSAGHDLGAAIDMFFNNQEAMDTDTVDSEDDIVIVDIKGIDSTDKSSKKVTTSVISMKDNDFDANEDVKGKDDVTAIEDIGKYTEEELLEKAVEASKSEYLENEPDVARMFERIISCFPNLDEPAVRTLCEEYKNRSVELEKYLEFNLNKILTKLGAKRAKLQSDISEFIAAGVEGAEDFLVEDCPACETPKIVQDPSEKVFVCFNPECLKELCRKCKTTQHIPLQCKDQMFEDNVEFQVIKVLPPKRGFNESDPLEVEFRLAEGEFLRMNSKNNKKYKIESIDVVFNKKLEANFNKRKEELAVEGFDKCLLLFHGTPQQNIQSILENNFDLSKVANGRAHGNGVYFSECPEVSLDYSTDRRQKSLILCKVLMSNNLKEVKHRGETRCWAVVVPDVNQILPKYVINFT